MDNQPTDGFRSEVFIRLKRVEELMAEAIAQRVPLPDQISMQHLSTALGTANLIALLLDSLLRIETQNAKMIAVMERIAEKKR
jgi:hypothetical protein